MRVWSYGLTRALPSAQATLCSVLRWGRRSAGGRIVFITTATNQWLRQRLCEEGFEIRALTRPYPAVDDWQAGDTQHGRDPTQPLGWCSTATTSISSINDEERKPVLSWQFIDNIAALPHYCADVLINQNVYAEDLAYSCEPYTRQLVGVRYAMLREEFAAYREVGRAVGAQARRILIMMGRSDPQNATVKVLAALQDAQVPALKVRVLVGAANLQLKEIRATASRLCFPAELVVATTRVAEHLAWAEVAIAAAGTSAIESRVPGRAKLLMVAAQDQAPVAAKLEALGAARNLGWVSRITATQIRSELWDLLDAPQIRAAMAEQGRHQVDGQGAARVVAATLSSEPAQRRAYGLRDE